MEEEEEEEDERREAAIASRPSLQPNFKPTTSVSHSQLSKFHELHKRRLQIKAKSKMKAKQKGKHSKMSRPQSQSLDSHELTEENSNNKETDESKSAPIPKVCTSTEQEETISGKSISKKRQKLHWGLDTKERWERKANM